MGEPVTFATANHSTTPRKPRWLERQNAIVDVAASMFAQRGYSATGLSELCTATGLGKGALYYYIESKENLLCMVHDRVGVPVMQSSVAVTTMQATPSEQLRVLGIELIRIITSFPDHSWVLFHDWRALGDARRTVFMDNRRRYQRTLQSILERGIDDGEFQIHDVRLAVLAWLGLHNYTYQWYRSDGRLNPIQVASELYDIFGRGILRRSD